MIRKIQSIHLYWFHACLNKLTCCLVQNKLKHLKGPLMSLKLESLVQNSSNPSGLSCISQYTHFAMSHACIILLHIVWWWLCISALYDRFCPRGVPWLPQRRTIPVHRPIRQATNHLIISIQSHVLAPALFYCIKTTRFKLLCVAVVEPTFLCMTCHCHSN